MKKQSLLLLLFVAFGSFVCAQNSGAPKPKSPLKQELNPNTDPQNQKSPAPEPAPAPTPAPRSVAPRSANAGKSGKSSRTTPPPPPQQPAKEAVPVPAPTQSAPTEKAKPVPAPPQSETDSEKQFTESPAAATKRKLIADGYTVCMTHPDFGKVYCNEAQTKQRKGIRTTYFYIDEDGIAVPIEASALSDQINAAKRVDRPAKTSVKNEPVPLP